MRLRTLLLLALPVLLSLALWWGNRDLPAAAPAAATLFAHRGIAQRYDERDLRNDTCTAQRLLPPRHALLENTLPAIRASFEAGADVVEIDVHPTTDGQFAVFHDWTLECRTDGRGPTRAHSLAQLKQLDIGYGYTADGGKTYPFRGQGVGLMPSLAEVLAAFPDRRFLINVKSRDPAEGEQLAAALRQLPPGQRRRLAVYGGDEPVARVRALLPELRTSSRASLQSCLLGYLAPGWGGQLPAACQRSIVLVPVNLAPLLWGWPNRMQRRLQRVDSELVTIGPWSGGFTTGIDQEQDLARLPPGYAGGIWTNEVDWLARRLRDR